MMILCRSEQSRKCPLCARQIGEYLIHNIRSKYDYQKHYLTPLRTSPRPDMPLVRVRATQRRIPRDVEWGRSARREREQERRAADELERAIERRRWVYRYKLYAKVHPTRSYIGPQPLTGNSACRLQHLHPLSAISHTSAIFQQPRSHQEGNDIHTQRAACVGIAGRRGARLYI